jgi:hypothetical protein
LKSDKNNLIRSEFNSAFFFSSSPSIKKLATTEARTETVHVETVPNLRKSSPTNQSSKSFASTIPG